MNMTGDVLIDKWAEVPVPADSSRRLSSMYTTVLNQRGDMVKAILETISEPRALPAVFHCTAGKDRTGVLAALLLGIAGVPRGRIVEDYSLSARFLYGSPVIPSSDSYGRKLPTFDDYQAMWCPPTAMELTLDHLDDTYGGVESYLRHIGLDDAEISSIRGALTR